MVRPDGEPNARAEREPHKTYGNAGEAGVEIIQGSPHVIAFTHTLGKAPAAFPDSTKIKAQCRKTCRDERLGGSEYHFIVHRSAVKRVRMAHQGSQSRLCLRVPFQQRFQCPHGAGDKNSFDSRSFLP